MKPRGSYQIDVKGGKYHNSSFQESDLKALFSKLKNLKKLSEDDAYISLQVTFINELGSDVWSHIYLKEDENDIKRDVKAHSKGKTELSWGSIKFNMEADA